MKAISIFILLFISFNSNSQTAEDIINKYFKKNGGKENVCKKSTNTKEVLEVNLLDSKITTITTTYKSRAGKELVISEWKQNFESGEVVDAKSVDIFNGEKGTKFLYLTNNIVKTQDWDKNKIFYKLNETSLLGSCKSYKENGDSALYQGIEDFNSKKCYKIRYVKNYKKFDNTSGYKNLEYHFFDILNSLEVGLKNFDNDGNEIVTIGENFTKINGVYQAQKLTLKKRGEIVAILNLKGFSNDIILPDKEFEKAAYTK